MNYLQNETLAFLEHEEQLAQAAKRRLANQFPQEPLLPLAVWFQRLNAQRRKWFAPRRTVVTKQAFR